MTAEDKILAILREEIDLWTENDGGAGFAGHAELIARRIARELGLSGVIVSDGSISIDAVYERSILLRVPADDLRQTRPGVRVVVGSWTEKLEAPAAGPDGIGLVNKVQGDTQTPSDRHRR